MTAMLNIQMRRREAISKPVMDIDQEEPHLDELTEAA
jgi:hypothetical protein